MRPAFRWLLAVGFTVLPVAAVWILGQREFHLDVGTAVAIAGLLAAVLGAPLANWAATASTNPGIRRRRIVDLPAAAINFTGRDALLDRVGEDLRSGGPVAVLALNGLGGVGKTSLALEYARRNASRYDIVWWIDAADSALIGARVAELGEAAGWVERGADTGGAARQVRRRLRQEKRWLLVFDNVNTPDDVVSWLPDGPGHVLITSRDPGWRVVTRQVVDVDVFERTESVALLERSVRGITSEEAEAIASAVGDLPLAVAQACGVLAHTTMTPRAYLAAFPQRAAELMAVEKPPTYPVPLATAIGLAVERLHETDPAAVQILEVCAFMAPEPIPEAYFAMAASELPQPLAGVASSQVKLPEAFAAIGRLGLARLSGGSLQLHRLTREVIRSRWADPEAIRGWAEAVLIAATPKRPSFEFGTWAAWAVLVPHVLATPYLDCRNPAMRSVVVEAVWYLFERGDLRAFHPVLMELYRAWRDRLGVDHPDTLDIQHRLATADYQRGDYQSALALEQDCYRRRSLMYGLDAGMTLEAGVHVASYLDALGRSEEAMALHEDLMERTHRVLGDSSRLTLGAAHNMARSLSALGRHAEALTLHREVFNRREGRFGRMDSHTLLSGRDLADSLIHEGDVAAGVAMHQDFLARHREQLGPNHPNTLLSAHATGAAFAQVGRLRDARMLLRDTLDRRIETLGAAHPETKATALALAGVLRRLGRRGEARQVERMTQDTP